MPMPRWWGQINKRLFNPRAINGDKWDVLTHTGRSSGEIYQTPMEAIPVEGGYVVFLVYGRESDWVKNVLAAGIASLKTAGRIVELENPRVVTLSDIESEIPVNASRPPALLKVNELLRMDVVCRG